MFSKKNLPKLIISLIISVVVLWFIVIGVFFATSVIHMLQDFPLEIFIFQTIDECEQLIPADQTDAEIERYDSPEKDKNLKDLSYDAFFGMNFESDELQYEIFAYEFVDSDSALKYFINVTGKSIYEKDLPLSDDDENKQFLASMGAFNYELIAVYQNRAYVISAPKRFRQDINELLANTFSYKIV